MPDVLAAELLRTGIWRPREYKLLRRELMDGADTVDRQRRRQRGEFEDDELLDWYADQHVDVHDALAAWWEDCHEIGIVGSGCNGSCPWCTGSHYATEEDQVPLSYWTD